MKILLAYATTEGQTRKVAHFMADVWKEMGHEVSLIDVGDEAHHLEDHDATVLGGSVHMGALQAALLSFVKTHHQAIHANHSALFTVSLSMAGPDEEAKEDVRRAAISLLEQADWQPKEVVHFAGALRYTEYDWFKRYVMRLITHRKGSEDLDTSKDYEYTDWDQVRSFCQHFARGLG